MVFLGLTVQRPIITNPELYFIPGSFIVKPLSGASNHEIVGKRVILKFLLKLTDQKSGFTLTLGYLDPALNNPV